MRLLRRGAVSPATALLVLAFFNVPSIISACEADHGSEETCPAPDVSKADVARQNTKEILRKFKSKRILSVEFLRRINVGSHSITEMKLNRPEKLDSNDVDTSKWSVNKSALIHTISPTVLIEEMFTTGAVKISRNTSGKVLVVGMGGGYLNSYLHHTYPKINITAVEVEPKMVEISRKWFDLKLDDYHRVVVRDGADFIAEAAKNEEKYDAVLIDVSSNNSSSSETNFKPLSPTKPFYSKEFIASVAKILNEKGCVVLNMLPVLSPQIEKVQEAYKKMFKTCTLNSTHKTVKVLSCSNNPLKPYIRKGLRAQYVLFAKYPDTDEQARSIKELLNTIKSVKVK
ncbi:unnamed protein product [Nippostrongylus brasiliensis]|uniref:PABS domain-containing protein n=1 Tax=Nippostrongylus brasiliensis TaxID=27835 RepID=A0A0N4XXZ9_NIPBR|nr:unnamed protein product [Nippostrongylus brasiliensis]